MTLTDKELETMLRSRAVVPPSADFAARITRAARQTPQMARPNLLANLRAALEFLVPHPAAAFASVLVLGLVMGMGASNMELFSATDTALHLDLDETGGIL